MDVSDLNIVVFCQKRGQNKLEVEEIPIGPEKQKIRQMVCGWYDLSDSLSSGYVSCCGRRPGLVMGVHQFDSCPFLSLSLFLSRTDHMELDIKWGQ